MPPHTYGQNQKNLYEIMFLLPSIITKSREVENVERYFFNSAKFEKL